MKDITEILCKAFDVDEDQVLGAFDTEHEPVECNETDFEDDVLVQKDHDGNVVVGYVVHDPESADYWNDSDGNGELHTFRSEAERDAFVEERKAEGQVPLVVDHYKHGNEHYSVANTHNYPNLRGRDERGRRDVPPFLSVAGDGDPAPVEEADLLNATHPKGSAFEEEREPIIVLRDDLG